MPFSFTLGLGWGVGVIPSRVILRERALVSGDRSLVGSEASLLGGERGLLYEVRRASWMVISLLLAFTMPARSATCPSR